MLDEEPHVGALRLFRQRHTGQTAAETFRRDDISFLLVQRNGILERLASFAFASGLLEDLREGEECITMAIQRIRARDELQSCSYQIFCL
jgi:hypothetical protein